MIKKTIFLGVSGFALLATPAMARDGQVYAGVEAGYIHPNDIQFDINDDENDQILVNNEDSYEVGLLLGYDFGAFRLEGEVAATEFDVDTVVSDFTPVPTNTLPGATGTFEDVSGGIDVVSFMLNGMLDFGNDDGLSFSAGGGLGYAVFDGNFSVDESGPGVVVDKDGAFAYQGIAQVRYALSRSIDVGLKYKYMVIPELELTSTQGLDYSDDYESHSVLATLLYNFGGAQPAPPPPPAPVPAPPPPPPPAPPAPQPVTCNTGPYIVFFDWDESVITPAASQILDSAITAYGDCGMARIMLAGYTDTSGSQAYNLGLAARRNASVRDYLTARSVPDARITSEAFGEENLRVPTADGVRELQNRRVEITYGPGSGM